MNSPSVHYIVGAGLLLLLFLCDWFIYKGGNVLRDASQAAEKPYSMSRVQLWWWTNIIVAGFILVYLKTGILPDLNDTCLTLLGIGLGTTVAGRIIDGHDEAQKADRHQNHANQDFFTDILSDEQGVSIHRFQTLIFNVVYGVTFIVLVIETARVGTTPVSYFPSYNTATLGVLLGSSAGYLVAKTRENAQQAAKANAGKG